MVAEPPLAEAQRLAADNLTRLNQSAPPFLGRPWPDLMREARLTLVEAAYGYLRRLDGGVRVSKPVTQIVMAGHQPELFHPGVWVKNFAPQGLATRFGAMPVNLVVDNDTVRSTSLHFPVHQEPLPPIAEFQPYRAAEPFDQAAAGGPYEEYAVQDETLFASLPERVRPGWGFKPLLNEFWTAAVRTGRRTLLLGDRLAAARRELERRWNCENYEVPVSAICRTKPFAWFACDLLTNLPRLYVIYNAAVREYRARYGLRSTSHPVPDLAAEGNWLEAPFWAWRTGQKRRGRLMARLTPETVSLRVGDDFWPWLPREPMAMVRAFLDLERGASRSAAGH